MNKYILIFFPFFLVLNACKTSKSTSSSSTQKIEVQVPFDSKEFKTEGNLIRFRAKGVSSYDYEMARTDAQRVADGQIAQFLDGFTTNLSRRFTSETIIDLKSGFNKSINDDIKSFAEAKTSRARIIGEKAFEINTGGYEVWIVKELDISLLQERLWDTYKKSRVKDMKNDMDESKEDMERERFYKIYREERENTVNE